MTKLYITEFQTMASDGRSVIDAPSSPSVTVQTVNIGSASAQSNAFNSLTRFIRVVADSRCAVAFGANPTALVASSTRLMPGVPQFFGVTPGHKVAVIDASIRNYSSSFTFVPASSTTDAIEIIGAANKIIRVKGILLDGAASASLGFLASAIRRSALDTTGTPATQTAVSGDGTLAAATATIKSYTANPGGLGAAVGTVATSRFTLLSGSATTFRNPNYWDFDRTIGGVFLQAATDTLCVNFGGTPTTITALDASVYWSEEDV